ncbi:MAG: PEP-CTERM sorting domain-containing protein [Pyrinomonadaceae bacterium]
MRLDLDADPVTDVFALQTTSSIPEPTAMILLGTGLAGLAARARRKTRHKGKA